MKKKVYIVIFVIILIIGIVFAVWAVRTPESKPDNRTQTTDQQIDNQQKPPQDEQKNPQDEKKSQKEQKKIDKKNEQPVEDVAQLVGKTLYCGTEKLEFIDNKRVIRSFTDAPDDQFLYTYKVKGGKMTMTDSDGTKMQMTVTFKGGKVVMSDGNVDMTYQTKPSRAWENAERK